MLDRIMTLVLICPPPSLSGTPKWSLVDIVTTKEFATFIMPMGMVVMGLARYLEQWGKVFVLFPLWWCAVTSVNLMLQFGSEIEGQSPSLYPLSLINFIENNPYILKAYLFIQEVILPVLPDS